MTNVNETLVHEGVTFRKVNRKAKIGDKVLITWSDYEETGDVFAKGHIGNVVSESDIAMYELIVNFKGFGNSYVHSDGFKYLGSSEKSEYVVLEPVEQPQSSDLFVTEADVRNNPRQVIDLIANLARRLTLLEGEHQALGERVERLGNTSELAVSTVARNVETWAQEHENLKHELAKVNERTQPYQ
jgi:hypothetical protein